MSPEGLSKYSLQAVNVNEYTERSIAVSHIEPTEATLMIPKDSPKARTA